MAIQRITRAHKQRFERAAELYLDDCFRLRTAARVSEFAEKYLYVTRPYLSRVARAILGMSASQFLRDRQLNRAKRLLATTPLPIDQIATASAFGTRRTLHRVFLKATGMTPEEYRREVTK